MMFPKAGIVYVNCRLHPNMAGAVVVTPNQWYAKAARDGQFSLHDLPPGTYTVVAWHKTTGFIRKQVQVVEGVARCVATGPRGESVFGIRFVSAALRRQG